MTKLKTRILLYISIALLLLSTLFPLTAFAMPEVYEIAFDNTDVMDDLNDATVFGKKFDVNDYPKTPNGEVRLLDFAEYCFSTYPEYQKKFGLYVYVYNPTGAKVYDDVKNTIQLGFDYELNEDNEYEPKSWYNRCLKLLSASADNVFYKFKVVDENEEIHQRVLQTPEQRRYDVVALDLFGENQTVNAQAYKVGGSWTYSGFAKGCDLSAEEQSTLQVRIRQSQTLEIDDIRHTYYRSWKDSYHADQLTSVYFSVPKNIANDYDALYSVQAETYQYLTSPIICVYDRPTTIFTPDYSAFYNTLMSYRGIATPVVHNSNDQTYLIWGPDTISGGLAGSGILLGSFRYNNIESWSLEAEVCSTISWVMQVSDDTEFTVSSDEMLKYMQDYSNEFNLHNIRDKYSSGLFSYYYYANGLPDRNFDGGKLLIGVNTSGEDDITLVGSSSKYNGWADLFGKNDWSAESEPISPLVEVSFNDLSGLSDEEISSKYFIAKKEVGAFKDYVKGQIDRVVYLFRFADSDYITYPVEGGRVSWSSTRNEIGYMAQEVAYLDFDIISLGYMKNGVETRIPVVSSPIDIVSAIESGRDMLDLMYWIKQLLQFIGIIILLLLLLFIPGVANLLLTLLKFAGWLLTLPFRALGRLFKAIFKRRKG